MTKNRQGSGYSVDTINNDDFSWKMSEVKAPESIGKIIAIPACDISGKQNKHLTVRKGQVIEDSIVDAFKERIGLMLSDQRHNK